MSYRSPDFAGPEHFVKSQFMPLCSTDDEFESRQGKMSLVSVGIPIFQLVRKGESFKLAFLTEKHNIQKKGSIHGEQQN